MRRIYLDHNATAPLLDQVKEAIVASLDVFGNPSSLTMLGYEAKLTMEEARAEVAKLIGAETDEIYFTSGCTEANNWVLQGHTAICSNIEHPSVLAGARPVLAVDTDGMLAPEMLTKCDCDATLVSVMLANNEIGTVQPVAELAKIAHNRGMLFHTDCAQALGKMPVDVKVLGVDFASFSGHKIGALKGIGCLYVKKGVEVSTLLAGGHQERRRRAGTENLLGIISFGAAAKYVRENNVVAHFADRVTAVRDELQSRIVDNIENVTVNGGNAKRLPNTLNVSFAGAEGESIMLMLDQHGIVTSTGSACASSDGAPSHVIMALEPDPELAHGSIRFSFGAEADGREVDVVMEILPGVIEKLREMSTQ